MIRNKLIPSLTASLLLLAGASAHAESGIAVVQRDGQRTETPYSSLDRILITPQGITTVTRAGESRQTPYSSLDRICINAATSAAPSLEKDSFRVWPTLTDGDVYVSCTEDSGVNVYDLGGNLLLSVPSQNGETLHLPLGRLPAGMYVVTASGASVKIIKK
ncbi:MAG: T9SS type A sorting domain-containing protein [Muribaculaceae bacterium]|nr:T9SS type A sorting domain-containing protein [Muribaculaceae bacterium]